MTRIKSQPLLALTLLLASQSAWSQSAGGDLRLSLVAMSDYRRYGVSQTDSEPALRIGADYEHPSGFFAGGFVTNVEYAFEQGVANPRDIELNAYAGRLWRQPNWTANLSLARYVYPDTWRDYDYTLATGSLAFRDRYFFEVAASDDYQGVYGSSRQYRAGVAIPVPWETEIGINAGRFRYGNLIYREFNFWDIGVSRIFGRYAMDLRYHDNTYDGSGATAAPYAARWAMSLAYSIAPLDARRDSR